MGIKNINSQYQHICLANKQVTKRGDINLSYLRKISFHLSLITIILFTLAVSYYRGLFFDTDIYLFEIIVGIIFLLYFFAHLKENHDIFSQPYLWILSLITFIYFVHSFIADNQLSAYQELFRWLMVSQLFLLVFLIKRRNVKIYKYVFYSAVWMGVWTSLLAWFTAYNLTVFKDAFLNGRIASVFQYANTFGAIIAALLIGILVKTTSSNWKYSVLSVFSYLFTVTLIFSYSRGAWLVFAIFLILGLFFLNFRQQILYIVHLFLIGGAVLFTVSPISYSISEKDFSRWSLTIFIATIAITGFYIVFSLLISKIKFKRSKNIVRWVIPVLAIILLVVGYTQITNPQVLNKLPDSIKTRIESISLETQSLVERNNFYKDAVEMIKDRPLFGHGGGVWKEKFESYQSYPYVSRQVHNFYFKLPVEIGVIGLLAFASFLLLIAWSLAKIRNQDEEHNNILLSIGLAATFLLAHSFIDFNMSFAYFLGLVLIFLGLIAQPLSWNFRARGIIKSISLIIFIVLTLISLFISTRFFVAENSAKKLVNMNQSDQIISRLDYIISLNPYNLDYRFGKIDYYKKLYNLTQREDFKTIVLDEAFLINGMRQKNPLALLKTAQAYADFGYVVNSLDLLEEGIKNNPWNEDLYARYASYSFDLAKYYKKNNEIEKSKEITARIYQTFEDLMEKRRYLDSLVTTLRYPAFQPPLEIELAVGRALVLDGKYDEGIKYLKPITTDKYISAKTRNTTKITDEEKIEMKNEAILWVAFAYHNLNNPEKVQEFLSLGDKDTVSKLYDDLVKYWEE